MLKPFLWFLRYKVNKPDKPNNPKSFQIISIYKPRYSFYSQNPQKSQLPIFCIIFLQKEKLSSEGFNKALYD